MSSTSWRSVNSAGHTSITRRWLGILLWLAALALGVLAYKQLHETRIIDGTWNFQSWWFQFHQEGERLLNTAKDWFR